MIKNVELSRNAEKDIKRLPKQIRNKLLAWIEAIEEIGLEEVRKSKGLHDEPLKGKRAGQRSIRLNKAYRAIYKVVKKRIEIAIVEEVNKHEY